MITRVNLLVAGLLAVAGTAGVVRGQAQSGAAPPGAASGAPAVPEAPRETWTVRIEPQVWYVAPAGELTMPGSPAGTPPVKLSTLNADNPEASAAGQVTIRVSANEDAVWGTPEFWKRGWFFNVGGASYSGSGDAAAPAGGLVIGSLAVAAGAAVSTDVKWSEFQALAGKWVTGSGFNTGGDVGADLYAVAGLRLHDQDVTVTSGGGSVTSSETFWAPMVGLRLDVQLPHNFAVVIDGNIGYLPGDPSCFTWQIAPTFIWRPTANIGIEIGYCLMGADCESGDVASGDYYRLDGSLAGLFAGVEIRF